MAPVKVRGLSVAAALLWVSCAAVLLSTFAPAFASGGSAASAPSPVSSLLPSSGGHAQPALLLDPPLLPPKIVASVAVGTEPEVGVTDLANGLVYVANSISNTVSVLNATSVVGTVDLHANFSGTPVYLVYDSLNPTVYVVDRYDGEFPFGAVNVINGTSVVATLAVGYLPDYAVLDPSNGYLYVTNSASNNVTVIDGNARIASLTVGTGPCAAAYDPSDGDVFVANAGSSNVSLLSGTTAVGSMPAGVGPSSVAYDPLDDEIYVANSLSDNVTIENASAVVGNVPVGSDPSFVAFNPTVGGVEVADTNSNNVTVLSGTAAVATVPVATGPVWLGVGPFGGFTFVVGGDANAVTVLDGTTFVGNVTVGGFPVYGVADPSNQREYLVNSGTNNVSVFAVTYTVTFNETGLAPGTSWSVNLAGSVNSSVSSSIAFTEPSGSYGYSVATPSGYVFVRSDPSSPILVTNYGVTVNVTFAPVPSVPYNLTFVETGLGTGCTSRGGGSGGWGPGRDGPQGSPLCCKASSPAWSVSVGSLTKTTTNSSITFSEVNGTYNYTVHPPSGYTVTSSVPLSPVTIYGANVTVNVMFSPSSQPRPLSITFQERGLHRGTVWCVTVNVTKCSSDEQILFSGLFPGTYAFDVSAVTGYTVQPSSGSVTLADWSVTVQVRFFSNGHHGCGGQISAGAP